MLVLFILTLFDDGECQKCGVYISYIFRIYSLFWAVFFLSVCMGTTLFGVVSSLYFRESFRHRYLTAVRSSSKLKIENGIGDTAITNLGSLTLIKRRFWPLSTRRKTLTDIALDRSITPLPPCSEIDVVKVTGNA